MSSSNKNRAVKKAIKKLKRKKSSALKMKNEKLISSANKKQQCEYSYEFEHDGEVIRRNLEPDSAVKVVRDMTQA